MMELLRTIPRRESETIFNGPDGKPLEDIKRSFRTALKRARIKEFHFHDLIRHTSASYMVMREASLKAVQEHLGHTSLAMTQRYAHLSPEQRSEVERLRGIFYGKVSDDKNLVRNEEAPRFPEEPHAYANA